MIDIVYIINLAINLILVNVVWCIRCNVLRMKYVIEQRIIKIHFQFIAC